MWQWINQWFHRMGSPPYFFRKMVAWQFFFGLVAFSLMVIGLFWGLFIAPEDYQQGDSFRIIYIHVPSASVAMTAYAAMAFASLVFMVWRIKVADILAEVSAPVGLSFTVLALATGSIWGKPTWGTWWEWDARLTSMLILGFLFLGVMALRKSIPSQIRASKAAGILAIVGVINLPIIKYSVEWWQTLHQGSTFSVTEKPKMPAEMWIPLLISLLGIYSFAAWAGLKLARLKILIRESGNRWVDDWIAQAYPELLNPSSEETT